MGACDKCKPDKPETHEQVVGDAGCATFYASVKKCMKVHQGNVADCAEEWKSFKKCFNDQKCEGMKGN